MIAENPIIEAIYSRKTKNDVIVFEKCFHMLLEHIIVGKLNNVFDEFLRLDKGSL